MPKRVKVEGNPYRPRVTQGAVRVTRPIRWGNPYPVHEHGRHEAIRLYYEHLMSRPELLDRARRELAGEDLACWCPPGEACHGDVLLGMVNDPADVTDCPCSTCDNHGACFACRRHADCPRCLAPEPEDTR